MTTLPSTDFESHYIEGYVHQMGGAHVKVPLITEIEEGFWQGGCIGGVALPENFTRVLSLYKWEQYELPEGCERITVTMYDSRSEPVDLREITELAKQINKWRLTGHDVLVHCQAGLNRSGLVAAASLIRLGQSADAAITKLRETRSPAVLCNSAFEAFLRDNEEAIRKS